MFKVSENMICGIKIQHYYICTAPDLNFIMRLLWILYSDDVTLQSSSFVCVWKSFMIFNTGGGIVPLPAPASLLRSQGFLEQRGRWELDRAGCFTAVLAHSQLRDAQGSEGKSSTDAPLRCVVSKDSHAQHGRRRGHLDAVKPPHPTSPLLGSWLLLLKQHREERWSPGALTWEAVTDMSGHRVQFADLPPSDHKGSPKSHSKKTNIHIYIYVCWPWF